MASNTAPLPPAVTAPPGAVPSSRFAETSGADLYWVPHEEEVWAPCRLQNISDEAAALRTNDGHIITVSRKALQRLAPVQDQQLEGVDDICTLSTVNEAALLHTIRTRYAKQLIYTRVSRILISLNPFTPLTIYSLQDLLRHANAADSLDLEPHIFGTGHDAMRGLREGSRDQAVVISGESGAGKTESAKLLLKYVAEVVRSGSASSRGSGVEEKVMRTNPILETFGNAMTTRNNNSSRFGKWLDMRFSANLDMLGCRVTSYLLEVTRVCSQMQGERSFHIFFQLLKMKDHPMLAGLKLEGKDNYRYLCNSVHTAPGIDDSQCFEEMLEAFGTLGFSQEEQLQIFHIVVSALNLGNCDFQPNGEELQFEHKAAVERAAELLEVDAEALARCMLWRKVVTGRDATETPLREEQARAVRDGLSRMLYGHLFEWLIRRINCQLETADTVASTSQAEASSVSADRLLGILDISGFESFERNSLEQLLINLSNEHLQLQFNDHVFKTELEDCAKEGVSLKEAINYADNSECVALLDGRGGVLDMLDEEITMPKASDLTFATKVVRELTRNSKLVTPKFSGMAIFGVHHYAGDVTYTCEGFLEKNADRLPSEDALKLLSASKLPVIASVGQLLREQAMGSDVSSKAKRGGKSATSRFRTSLRSLMAKISSADNHYIRCIKPNLEKVPARFTAQMVREQLLFSGVLEAVRIRQQGYASRLPFFAFALRYRCVVAIRSASSAEQLRPLPPTLTADGANVEAAVRELIAQLLLKLGIPPTTASLVLGRTKVFLKTEIVALLESARTSASMLAVLHIQRFIRGALVRKRFAKIKPLLLEILTWLNTHCPSAVWQKGELRSMSFLQHLNGSFESAEHELAYIDSRRDRGEDLPVSFGVLQRAAVARKRLSQEVEALRGVRAALHNCSTDLKVIDDVLGHARHVGLEGNVDVGNLSSRAQSIRMQLPLIGALQDVLGSKDFARLPIVMREVEGAGLYANRERWIPELGGDQILAAVIKMAEEEEARRKKEEEEARKRKEEEEARRREEEARRRKEEEEERKRQEDEEALKKQQEAEAFQAARAARAAEREAALKAARQAAAARQTMPEADCASDALADDALSGAGVDLETFKQAIERLDASVARIKTTPLGMELSEILHELRTEESRAADASKDTELHIDPVALLEPTERLMAAAGRIGGVPLARELTEIAQSLELAPAADVGGVGSLERQPAVDVSSWSVDDLRRSVVRLMEEKEELRHALQHALLESLEREESLLVECESLRVARPLTTDVSHDNQASKLEKQFQTALEEEARASRAVRNRLIAESSKLRAELAAEQANSRALRAELTALRALHKNGAGAAALAASSNGVKRAEQPQHEMTQDHSSVLPNAPNLPATPSVLARPKAASIVLKDTGPADATVEIAASQKPMKAVLLSEASLGPPNQRNDDLKKVNPRRNLDFVQRDFKPFPGADVQDGELTNNSGACSIALHAADIEGWYVCKDCNGQLFFQHLETGHTQWESPAKQDMPVADGVVEQPDLVEPDPTTMVHAVQDAATQQVAEQIVEQPPAVQDRAAESAVEPAETTHATGDHGFARPSVMQPTVMQPDVQLHTLEQPAADSSAYSSPERQAALQAYNQALQAVMVHAPVNQVLDDRSVLVPAAESQSHPAQHVAVQPVATHPATLQPTVMHPTQVQPILVQHAATHQNFALPSVVPPDASVHPSTSIGAGGWQACRDSNGYVYYHHIASGHTQWEPPPAIFNDAMLSSYATAAPSHAGADAYKTPAPSSNGRAARPNGFQSASQLLEV